jgi:hypothetical protein
MTGAPSALTKPDPFSLTGTDPGDARESAICTMSAVIERSVAAARRHAPSDADLFFFGVMDALGACGRKASELGQGQAAAFCSLAKPPLTQRRGTRLRGGSKRGSIGLTAMETGTRVCVELAPIAASATDHRDPPGARSGREWASGRVGERASRSAAGERVNARAVAPSGR